MVTICSHVTPRKSTHHGDHRFNGFWSRHCHLGPGPILGRVDEAIALYRKALITNPELSAAYNNLAAAFVRKGLYEEAVTELDAALDIEPGNATYHYNYAILILQLGDIEMARQHFSEALSINPAYESARQGLESIEAGKPNSGKNP